MLIATIYQYTLLGMLLVGAPTANYVDMFDYRAHFEVKKWVYNTKNPFGEFVPKAYIPNSALQVHMEFDVFYFMTLNVGMRGMAGEGGFNFGIGGGHWGMEMRLFGNEKIGVKIGVEHESLHSFDSTYKAGAEDVFWIRVCYNCTLGKKQKYLSQIIFRK